jgi:hypothetical protein
MSLRVGSGSIEFQLSPKDLATSPPNPHYYSYLVGVYEEAELLGREVRIQVTIDAADKVPETDERNNVLTVVATMPATVPASRNVYVPCRAE